MPTRTDISNFARSLIAGALALVSLSVAFAECVTLEPVYRPSSPHVRITTVRNGQAMKGVKIESQPPVAGELFSLSTGSDGVALLPVLPSGKQCFVATAQDKSEAELCVEVSSTAGAKNTFFAIEMPPTLDQSELLRAQAIPVTERLQEFRGTIQDQSGAGIQNAQIVVARRDSADQTPTRLLADSEGRFSASLAPGIYAVLFHAPGFRTQITVFEVGDKLAAKDLQVVLKLGGC